MAIDYPQMFRDLIVHYNELVHDRKKIEVEMAKLTQTIEATFNMLTPVQQVRVAEYAAKLEGRSRSLKESVLMALKARSGEWLTPPDVRDYLTTIGFNFGTASANGLASIGTTLKRLVPAEVETKQLAGGQVAYRILGYDALGVTDAQVKERLNRK